MYKLVVRRHFDASHIVEGHPGKCATLHGHRWVAEVQVVCQTLNAIQMGIDFGAIKALLDQHLPDHQHVNDVLPAGYNATAERISEWLHKLLAPEVEKLGGRLVGVTIWETPDCAATYIPPDAVGER